MNGTWINWRTAQPWEAQAVSHGYKCAQERDLVLLAGLLAGETARVPETVRGKLVTDLDTEWLG